MNSFLNQGEFGSIELNEQAKTRKLIQERWDRLGFTEGLSGYIKENVATLYENQAKVLLREASDASNSGSFETVVFPIIRRIFSKLLANDIVSVQAMNLPVGKLFFMLPVTSERQWEGLAADGSIQDGATGSHTGLMGYDREDRNLNGAKVGRYYLPDEVVDGIEEKFVDAAGTEKTLAELKALPVAEQASYRKVGPEVTKYFKKSLYDLFYNDFLFDNSKGKVHIKVGSAIPVEFDGGELVPFTGTPKVCGLDNTVRNVILKVSGFNSYNASKLTGPDGNEMDSEAFLASLKVVSKVAIAADATLGSAEFAAMESIPFRVVTQRYGKGIVEYASLCDAGGAMYIELDFAKPT